MLLRLCKPCVFWLIVAVSVSCVRLIEMEDECTKWRLKIHNEIEESGQALDLGLYVHNFAAVVTPSVDTYTNLQLQIEEKALESNLYKGSADETNRTRQSLLNNSNIKKLIKECKNYHSELQCSQSKYRSADGTCNNLKNPFWGSSSDTVDRLLPAAYDGISGIRKSVKGGDLPDYRNISLKLKNTSNPSHKVSAFFPFFGQSIAHDVSLVPGISTNGSAIDCCSSQGNESYCVNTYLSKDDPFFGQYNYTCVPILRTAPYPTCELNKRIQMNKNTAFLDLSIIYGSTEGELRKIREDNSGRVRDQNSDFGVLLPKAVDEDTLFCPVNETDQCFLSGDERANQHILLTSMHTMFARLHNKLHDILHPLNPQWEGEKLFQETRRLVVALAQHMVYDEFLPWLVGSLNMKKYNLSTDFIRGSSYYDSISPNILVEFNTASFRLHSMVPSKMSKQHPKIPLNLAFSFTCPIHQGQLSSYVGGSCELPSERNDHFMKDDLTDYLYRPPQATYGDDLAAINVARGRDHGLPIYIDAVSKCSDGEFKIQKFSDLEQLMTTDNVQLLKSIYKDVRDIDLWIGLILEKETDDGVVGPTAACISSINFHRLKFGDNFFFSHKNGRYPFTKAQLLTIKQYSFSRFICDTTNNLRVRKHPILLPGNKNPMIYCKSFPQLDLEAWKDSSLNS